MTNADHSVFIELDYTGRVNGAVFDTTQGADAPRGFKGEFTPAVVKLGSGQLLPGLDAFLVGKPAGTYTVSLTAEQAFGKKRADRIQFMPLASFGKESKKLAPGLPITVGEMHGVVKSVGGGRVVVDFNHPLAGQAIEYTVIHHGVVTDPVKKVRSILKAMLGADLPVAAKDGKTVVKLPKGFPAEGLIKEIEKHTGETVVIEELAIAPHQHVHADGTVHDGDHHH